MNRRNDTAVAITRSRKMFRDAVEDMLLPVVELDLDHNLVYANRQARKLLKIHESGLLNGIHVRNMVASDQYSSVDKGLKALKDGAEPSPMTLRVVRQDGAELLTEAWAELIEENGQPAGYAVYVLDMTRRMAIEEKLQQREGLFQWIIEYSSFAGIFVVNDDYRFEYLNDKLLDIIGRTRSEVLGHDFREFLHPESIDLVTDRYIRRQRGEEVPRVYEFKVMHSDGRPRDVKISSSVIVTGENAVKTIAQIQDITSEKKAQRALQESEQKYRRLLETMDSGFCIDNEEGIVVLVNDALVAMLGYDKADDLLGKSITIWTHGWTDEDVREKVATRIKGEADHYEVDLQHKDGHIIPTIAHASPIFGLEGEYQGSFAIFIDVSDLKNAEGEVKFLLDLLLHDIGNQLQLIIAGADFLTPDSKKEKIMNARQYILNGANRCIELITNIRRVEKSKSEPLKPVDFVEILHLQTKQFAAQYDITPEISGLQDGLHVLADNALEHLFWNLMENALKHNPRDEKRIWIRGERNNQMLRLFFEDNGPGLSRVEKNDLFNPARRSGGVGLHLVRRIVAKYGGQLGVADRIQGRPEDGLSISVLLRIAESPNKQH